MSIEKLRGLAQFGVLTDPDPYDLPLQAYTMAVNVRFRNGNISAGPVFRNVLNLGTTSPRYTFSYMPTAGTVLLFIGYMNGTVSRYESNAETAYSVSGYSPSSVEAAWTSTSLAQVVYVNRADRVPWALRPSDAAFQSLSALGSASPVGWDPGWTCGVLRTCAGALVALNVTEAGTNSPNKVKTSSFPSAGNVPGSWDQTSPSTSATENILSRMDGPITDGRELGEDLIIYGLREAWIMHADGSEFIYDYTKLPFDKGAINANCAFELAGKHYVFGLDDIWMHDGNSEESICDEKTRDTIFSTLNVTEAYRCWVDYNPRLDEMYFHYVSGDGYTAFAEQSVDGCNRSAVLNRKTMTWTFDDQPSTFSSCNTVISNALEYATVTSTYSTIGGSYQDQDDGLKRTNVYVGDTQASYSLTQSLYAFDPYGALSSVSYAVDTNATAPRYLERIGLDLNQLNAEIRGYKTVATIYPQARIGNGASDLLMAVGASDLINSTVPTYSDFQSYDGVTNYRLDFNVAGRWLSYKCVFNDYRELTITGFDIDLFTTGHY